MAGRCGGFSLLEVLVAFTILAVTLGAIYQVFGTGVTAARLGDEYTRAVLIAQSRLEALGREEALTAGVTQGRFDDVYGIEASIVPFVWSGPGDLGRPVPVEPFEARVVVFWNEAGRRREVSLSTILLGPAP